MSKNTSQTTVIPIHQATAWAPDTLTEVLRTGAQCLLAQAVEAHLAAHKDLLDDRGRRRVVRHGHLPEREVQAGIGEHDQPPEGGLGTGLRAMEPSRLEPQAVRLRLG